MHTLSQCSLQINLLIDNDHFKRFNLSFKMQFWLRQYSKNTEVGSDPIIKAIKFMQNNFPYSQRTRIFPIYIHFFILFYNKYSNRDECWSICRLFKKNLNSDYLYNNFVLKRILQVPYLASLEKKIKEIEKFAKVIDFQNIIFTNIVLFNYI